MKMKTMRMKKRMRQKMKTKRKTKKKIMMMRMQKRLIRESQVNQLVQLPVVDLQQIKSDVLEIFLL